MHVLSRDLCRACSFLPRLWSGRRTPGRPVAGGTSPGAGRLAPLAPALREQARRRRSPILDAVTGDFHAGAYDDLVPLGPHALHGAERHDLARLFAGLRLALAGPSDDLAVECGFVALDDVAVIVETAHEHVNEKSARAGAGCRGCLHNAVSPGIGGCERREHPPGHPSAALLPASLDLSEAQGAREGRGRALPRSLLREVTGEPTLTEDAASESVTTCRAGG